LPITSVDVSIATFFIRIISTDSTNKHCYNSLHSAANTIQ